MSVSRAGSGFKVSVQNQSPAGVESQEPKCTLLGYLHHMSANVLQVNLLGQIVSETATC